METDPILTELQRELAALKERVTALEAQAAAVGAVTCSSLTVVNAQNEAVEVIDSSGALRCRGLLVEAPGAATYLAYAPTVGELAIHGVDPAGGAPVKLVALNEEGLGRITLRPPLHFKVRSFVRLTPAPFGGRMELGDPNGKTICDGNASNFGSTWLFRSRDPHEGEVKLGVGGGGNAEIILTDANGKVTATPP